jgi:hypothetical protein
MEAKSKYYQMQLLFKKHSVFLLLIVSASLFGQDNIKIKDSIPEADFLSLIHMNRELSYITFFGGIGNIEPLLLEAKFASSFYIHKSENNWALELSAEILIRMENEESFPIRTPTYKPKITLYKKVNYLKKLLPEKVLFYNSYWYASLSHHSNGQDGNYYNQDSTGTNRVNGNFSTNFIKMGLTAYKHTRRNNKDQLQAFDFHMEYHPDGPLNRNAHELDKSFGFFRTYLDYKLYSIPLFKEKRDAFSDFFNRSRFELKTGWIFGNLSENPKRNFDKRFIASATFIYSPKWFNQLGFFIQYYRGQDYYNIWYPDTLSVLRIGITADPLEFMSIRKIFKGKKE